jgi:hypothetical protein
MSPIWLIAAMFLCAQVTPSIAPRLRLEADGHACSGFLRAEGGRLRWKSSFSTCDSAYQVVSHTEGNWTLQLTGKPGPASHACTFTVITVRQMGPQVKYPLWEVAGYTSMEKAKTVPPRPELDCSMQSSSPTN